jgi:hypothetical protein
MSADSDLIGIPVVLGAIVAFLAVLAAFFFIGPVFGILLVVRVIKANEIE